MAPYLSRAGAEVAEHKDRHQMVCSKRSLNPSNTEPAAAAAAAAVISGPNPSPLTVSRTSAVAAWVRLLLEAEHTEILRGFSQHSPVPRGREHCTLQTHL